jgi:hypothetical protein
LIDFCIMLCIPPSECNKFWFIFAIMLQWTKMCARFNAERTSLRWHLANSEYYPVILLNKAVLTESLIYCNNVRK